MFKTLLITSLLTIVAACGFATTSAAELHLRRECVCEAALVTLGDVAGIYANDADLVSRLSRVELFPAPAEGQSRLVRSREIQDILSQRGVDLRANRIAGASTVRISAAKPPAVEVPKNEPGVVEPVETPEPEKSKVAKAEPRIDVVATTRPLQRGQVIQASDLRIESVSPRLATGAVFHADRIVGQEVTRPLSAGQPVRQSDVRPAILVNRGSVVTVFARAGGVQVRTSAKATEDGAKDDVIKMQSLLDRDETFVARVTGFKEVEVFAGSPRIESPAASAAPVQRPTSFGLRVGSTNDQ